MSIVSEEMEKKMTQKKEVTFLQAIAQAMWEEMERDESVFLLGEDIGVYGGAFKVTEGFLDHFGPERVIDTPLAEAAFVGGAIGAALMGMRPVVEFQYADFASCAWDQIINMAAKMHYRSGDSVPMVMRCPSGAGLRAGPFHSQSPEGFFSHVPGLKVVVPGTPYDAKGLLKAAIRDDDPVMFFEHKFLYRRLKEELPDEDYTVPIGRARIQREGEDVTVITYGAMLQKTMEAADLLSQDGISVEVLDLRTLLPLDKETVLNSVSKTSKALIVHEDTRTLGIGAEVAAIIADEGFGSLDGPVKRLTAPDSPVPYSPPMEDYYLPQVDEIVSVVKELVKY